LKKAHNPDIWINELEDYQMIFEGLGSSIFDNQFIIHILNNMTDDYDLQLMMMKRRVTDKSNSLVFDVICDDSNPILQRLTENQNVESVNDNNQEAEFLVPNLKENDEIVV
jgi:hypothetical protein